MNKQEMIKLINNTWEAVEESVAGNILAENNNGIKTYNTMPYQIFMQLFGSELPHISITTTNLKQSGGLDMKLEDGGESWKKES